jgi:UDP-N-acetylmuramoyl-L-alanyl-D-glutamate--2,6-diaminopimelate ligase
MRLRDLVEAICDEIKLVIGDTGIEVSGIQCDSREVSPGDLFVCIRGYRVDGHSFIDEAISKGCSAIVLEDIPDREFPVPVISVRNTRKALALLSSNLFGNPSSKMRLVGITGTNGKTTTAYLIESVMKAAGMNVGVIGTVSYRFSGKEFPASQTTPGPVELQRILSHMVDEGVTHLVMEVSSHALKQDRVLGCLYDLSIFTNLTRDHLDFHGDLEDYFLSKARLFWEFTRGKAILNLDDPYSRRIMDGMSGSVGVITYGLDAEGADVSARIREAGFEGAVFELLVREGGAFPMRISIPGTIYNVYNAIAAATASLELGIDPGTIAEGLEALRSVPGRFELVDCGQDFTVVVDYAHTDDALRRVLIAARGLSKGRVITVFGCGGDRDRTKRPLMGRVAALLSDFFIITSDNPRSEDPMAIISEIMKGVEDVCQDRSRYDIIADRREAIYRAIGMARPGDLVVIAGKGHETYQIIGSEVRHFDDREVAREALSKGYGG